MLKERHYLWCLVAFGVLGILMYAWKATEAFPSASIDLKVSGRSIGSEARRLAETFGYQEPKSISATGFTFDDSAKTFLEYELGLSEAFALMKSTVPVWYWTNRFCVPLSQEEIKIWLSPAGQLVAFEHAVENDRAMPSLTRDQAFERAKTFVESELKGSLRDYKLVEDSKTTQSNRTDYSFIWEDTAASFNGARLRTIVCFSGDKITQYNHFLYIPESWQRKFSQLRAYNEVLADAAGVFYMLLTTGSFFVFIWAFASGLIRWRFALVVAGISALLSLLDSLNAIPSANFDYVTTLPFEAFRLNLLTSALTASVSSFIQIFPLTAAAETIYRRAYPTKIALEKLMTVNGLRCRQTLEGLIAGFGSFGVHLGWVVIFYLVGRHFGVWCPLEIENVETLGSTVPCFSALKIGWDASITEEFMYRVLGLTIAQRLTRNFWLANLLQAAAWAFMHSNYAQEPPYARGIELTVVGLFYGFIMRKYGLIACVFSHNLLDSFLGLVPLLVSPIALLKVSAILSFSLFILPIALSVGLQRKRGELADHDLTNAGIPPPPLKLSDVAATIVAKGFLYQPLKRHVRWILSAIVLLFTSIQLAFFFPTVGCKARLTVSREQAIELAKQVLKERDIDSAGYSIVASTLRGLGDDECQYAFEHKGIPETDAIMQETQCVLGWQVRFFRAQVQQEYLVTLNGDGKFYSFGMIKPEAEAGITASKEEAQKQASEFLQSKHAEIVPFILDDATTDVRDKRTDYSFTFKVPKLRIDKAPFSASIDWVDQKLVSYRNRWTIPDQWVFDHNRVSMRQNVCTTVLLACGSGLAVVLLIWAAGVIRSQAIAWRPAVLIGLGTSVLSLARSLDDLPNFYFGYGTDTPMSTYLIAQGVGELTGVFTTAATTTILAAFGLAAIKLLLPSTTFAAILKTTVWPDKGAESRANVNLWLDAILLGYAAGAVARAVDTIFGYLHTKLSPDVSLAPLNAASTLFNNAYPSLYVLADALNKGTDTIFLTAIAIGIYFKFLRRLSVFALFVILQSTLNASPERYLQDIGLNASSNILSSFLSFLFIAVARENALAYFLSSYVGTLLNGLRILIAHTGSIYNKEVLLILAFLLAPPAFLAYRLLKSRNENADNDQALSDLA